MKEINSGVYPTMVTPYNKDGSVDFGAVEALTEWYWNRGCQDIFTVCMSSEMFTLSFEERTALVRTVKRKAERLSASDPNGRVISVAASGHISDTVQEQAKELSGMYCAGADSVVLITNRATPMFCNADEWISQTEKLISALPEEADLGFYECPYPQKRPISDKMLLWMKKSGRINFIKDTSCDENVMKHRIELLKGSGIKLFNANVQTFLPTLKSGVAGFSGVMGNFNPEILVWLFNNYQKEPEKAQLVQDYICASAFMEGLQYPLCIKYLLSEHEGIGSLVKTRMSPDSVISEYNKYCAERGYELNEYVSGVLGL